jgi:signal transduction histidine kinase
MVADMVFHRLISEERLGTLGFGGARVALLDIKSSYWALRRHLEALVGRRLADEVLQQAGVNGGVSFARALVTSAPPADTQALRDCLAAYQAAGFGEFEIVELDWPFGRDQGEPAGRILIRGTNTFEAWMVHQHDHKVDTPVCSFTSGVLVGFANALCGRRDVVCVKRACQGKGDEACLFELLLAETAADTPVIAFDPDPFLSHQLNLLEILFDRMPMAIAILDRDLVLRRFNPTWAGFIDQYTPSTLRQVVPGVRFFDLAPGTESTLMPVVERVLAGETVRRESLRLESNGAVSFWDVAFSPLVEGGEVVGLVDVMTDATDRVLAYQTLEQQVEERTREIDRRRLVAEGLRDILSILNSNRPLDEILDFIVEQAGRLLGAEAVAIYRLGGEGEVLSIQAARGLEADYVADAKIPVGQSVTGQAVLKRKPVALSDVAHPPADDNLLFDRQREALLERLGTQYRALLAVPLKNGGTYGAITLYYPEPRAFTDEDVALAVAFSDQAALAIENTRLRTRMEKSAVAAERSRLARDLHDSVTQVLFSASLIAEVLPTVWERNRVEGEQALAEMRQLTRGALAEMRTLLLELRPAALMEAKLGDLLHQLAEAIIGRARMPVAVTVDDPCPLPHDVHVALYRIAQEALNNVTKHAEAGKAVVSLRCLPHASGPRPESSEREGVQQAELRITDDGRGFDLDEVTSDHLGVGIMRERAESIGASLTIESQPGRGTRVVVSWRSERKMEHADGTKPDTSASR